MTCRGSSATNGAHSAVRWPSLIGQPILSRSRRKTHAHLIKDAPGHTQPQDAHTVAPPAPPRSRGRHPSRRARSASEFFSENL